MSGYSGNNQVDLKGGGDEVLGLFECGYRLSASDEPQPALDYFAQAVALIPDSSDMWERLGTCFRDTGNFERADLCYQRATQLDESNFFVAFHWGLSWMDRRNVQEALPLFRKAADLKPENVFAHKHLAECYRVLKMSREWQAEMKKVLALEPSLWHKLPESFKRALQGAI
ncbi:MAG TPA: tetratricopeptide repeat protein [Terracidiphilus sp.]|jgi:tetratricopeptide (TPR) repeat protein